MKHTRLLAIVMALCLLAAALPLASAEEEVITLTIARKTDTLIENLETNETTKAIEEKFGVKLKFLEYPPPTRRPSWPSSWPPSPTFRTSSTLSWTT